MDERRRVMDERIRQHMALGREHYQRRDFAAAVVELRQVVALSQSFADVYNMLGVCLRYLGQLDDAIDNLERALEINPAYTEAALNLAVIYNDKGRYDEALQVYAQAKRQVDAHETRMDPHVAGKIANMHAAVAEAYLAASRPLAALNEYRKALDLCPQFVDLRTKLAMTLRELGEFDSACSELRRTLDEKPSYVHALIQLGACLQDMGRPEEAKQCWDKALGFEPENATARMYLRLLEVS